MESQTFRLPSYLVMVSSEVRLTMFWLPKYMVLRRRDGVGSIRVMTRRVVMVMAMMMLILVAIRNLLLSRLRLIGEGVVEEVVDPQVMILMILIILDLVLREMQIMVRLNPLMVLFLKAIHLNLMMVGPK